MKLLISHYIVNDLEKTLPDGLNPDPEEPEAKTYLKIGTGRRLADGVEIDADEDDLIELFSRAGSTIAMARENLDSITDAKERDYWNKDISAWKLLVAKVQLMMSHQPGARRGTNE